MRSNTLFLVVVVTFALLIAMVWVVGVVWARRFVDQMPPQRQNSVLIAWACMTPVVAILSVWVKANVTDARSGFSYADASVLLTWLLVSLMMLCGGLWSRLARWRREKRENR